VELGDSDRAGAAERLKAVLRSKGLTLYKVSQNTRALYGRSSPHFLPHNLYYELELGTFSPSLHQLFALSQISNYRFHDWLRVFKVDPEDIVRMQLLLPSKRTMLLDSSLCDPASTIPWFRDKPGNFPAPAIGPIGRLLALASPERLGSMQQGNADDFVYAKIGLEDALAFPDLIPGSVVRAKAWPARTTLPIISRRGSNCLYLIEHANGYCCCRLQEVGNHCFVPISTQLPYAQVELKIPTEARILGVVDLEIRSLLKLEQPHVPRELAMHWRPLNLAPREMKLSQMLRGARLRAGLSLRAASAMSRLIASELRNEHYFAAPGSLSDYEATDVPPRHIHKAITLCALYGLHFSTFLKSIGLHVEEAGKHPIPDDLVPRDRPIEPRDSERDTQEATGFLNYLLRRSEHVPFFLRNSISGFAGMTIPSINDYFWVGGDQTPLHPLLVKGLIVVVNRHKKRAIHFRSKPLWQQPLYILLRRNGTYMCGCCSLEQSTLVTHPYSPNHQRSEHLRNHQDAEVVGQIVAVARGF
jgi:transcriptional regulator with XRE-family HTH domain